MLLPVRARVMPKLALEDVGLRIVDDTGFPKKQALGGRRAAVRALVAAQIPVSV
jgi:hypothetical protein